MFQCAVVRSMNSTLMPEPREVAPDPGRGRDIRILIVEDHAPTGRAVAALLKGTLGPGPFGSAIDVVTVPDAESALARVTHDPPDVVIMDISLPGMNGIEATRRMRDLAPALPVIIHSRSDTDLHRSMAAAVGVRAFISKQCTAQELPSSIQVILQGGGAKEAAAARGE